MTNPEERGDPWKEALTCYESYSDEIIKVGLDWPYEFKFDYIKPGIEITKLIINNEGFRYLIIFSIY